MSATFGIATPFPGTEFYISLEKEGLIFERDWAKYDENSSVFKLSGIDRQRIEELRTYCLGKFWTADTFVDWLAVEQKRGAGRKSLSRFVADRIAELVFLAKAGSTQQASSESMINHFKVFVQAMADSRVEEYTKKLGMHQVIDMSRFLAILGEQTIQLTIRYENRPLTSYIMKTTRNAVEYIRVISGRQDGATIDLNIDFNSNYFDGKASSTSRFLRNVVQDYLSQALRLSSVGDIHGTLNMLKLTLAVYTEFISTKLAGF
jgi:hypothetical protein